MSLALHPLYEALPTDRALERLFLRVNFQMVLEVGCVVEVQHVFSVNQVVFLAGNLLREPLSADRTQEGLLPGMGFQVVPEIKLKSQMSKYWTLIMIMSPKMDADACNE
ncbi:hypothetical protein JTE90_007919 [Oedothorax gibbosus]|uniref:Uncharacterized protein n=1 Tax=Oedothorax gibbosus TaxID=931172 RepID=A0AAV6VJ65_9ARAC|nr:hypothetical protein JTE90_007919 [Oedothorax gibbosus]